MYLGVVFLYIYLAWVSLRFQDLQTDIFRENGKLIFFLFHFLFSCLYSSALKFLICLTDLSCSCLFSLFTLCFLQFLSSETLSSLLFSTISDLLLSLSSNFFFNFIFFNSEISFFFFVFSISNNKIPICSTTVYIFFLLNA